MLKLCGNVRLLLITQLIAPILVSCGGGGDSSVTTLTGAGVAGAAAGSVVSLDTPTGPNTTEVIVDSGPASFSIGTANVPFVTVSVCAPNSTTCVTIDHVFLDTGSYGLRLLKSAVNKLSLPAVTLSADPQFNTPSGTSVECYPFVLGGVWGPLAQADVHIAGETASSIPIQVIDDTNSNSLTPPADCVAASGGTLFNSASSLQANGILGIGMIPYDCGLTCTSPANYAGFHVQYYVCPDLVTAHCQPAGVPIAQQTQNPVAHFVPDDHNPQPDNNGTIISLPALPALGAGVAKGRLIFGIGTRANNQISPSAKVVFVDVNPASSSYLYFKTSIGSTVFSDSYIDSGSNALFFNDISIPQNCKSSSGSATSAGWYCPSGAAAVRSALMTDYLGHTSPVDFSIANADVLFSGSSTAFNNLGGSVPQAPQTFAWGLSFFFGRSVYTSIWGQPLSTNGPWNAY